MNDAEFWEMSDDDRDAINRMRSRGYAVVVFIPNELRKANAAHVEERLETLDNEIIADLND